MPERSAYWVPRVIGHRGAPAHAPENTLSGLRRAAELGATWVEFDAKLSRCGFPFILHDDRLERTTDGFGPVAEAMAEQIRELDAGSWFAPAFAGEPVPTLEQALALCIELDLYPNVEVKPCIGRDRDTARATLETIDRRWPASWPPPLVSSFQIPVLEEARDRAPNVPRGWLARRLPGNWREIFFDLGCISLHLPADELTREQVETIKAENVLLLVFTVDDPWQARELFTWGVDAVFSDAPDRVLPVAADFDPPDAAAIRLSWVELQ